VVLIFLEHLRNELDQQGRYSARLLINNGLLLLWTLRALRTFIQTTACHRHVQLNNQIQLILRRAVNELAEQIEARLVDTLDHAVQKDFAKDRNQAPRVLQLDLLKARHDLELTGGRPL